MLYEIHMLKNYPATCLNRDDSGSPKTCLFGGVTRGRISSQCLKRSWRTSLTFREEVGDENLGIRTRKMPALVGEKLLAMNVSQEYVDAIMPKLSSIGNSKGEDSKSGNSTSQIIFYDKKEIDAVSAAVFDLLGTCKSAYEVKKLTIKCIQEALPVTTPVSLDVALFGRMVTCDQFLNVDAAMAVAHAISVNKISNESDYFTAMDDLLVNNNVQGAALIGDSDFNSSCYYIYASIDSDKLRENLHYADNPGGIVQKAIPAMIRAMAYTNPSGKQNSFAGQVLPCAVMVDCKEKKVPTSLVNAFVDPVIRGNVELLGTEMLCKEADMISRSYSLPVSQRLWFCVDKYDVAPVTATKICASFPELVESVSATL